jgi:ferredoxin
MEVHVDRDLCEANGVCEGVAPHIFRLDDDDQLHITQPAAADEERELVMRAVDFCPMAALSIRE